MPTQKIRFPLRLSATSLLACLVIASLGKADTHTIRDNTGRIRLPATHKGGITSDKTHDLTHLDEWPVEGLIEEDSGIDWNELTNKGEAWHVEAPPKKLKTPVTLNGGSLSMAASKI